MPSRFIKELSANLVECIETEKPNREIMDNDRLQKYNGLGQNKGMFKTPEVFLSSLNENNNFEEVDLSKFKVGISVNHRKFGIGKILSIQPEDDDLKLEIEFETFGIKRLMAKFARLEILN